MHNFVNVTTVVKNKYKICYVNKKNKQQCILYAVVFSFSFLLLSIISLNSSLNVTSYLKIFQKLNMPYLTIQNNDVEDYLATSNVINKNLKFISPVKCEKYEISGGDINYTIDNYIMVIAPEDGVVTNISYTNSGEKFIEITHANDYVTRIVNVSICGCSVNEIVGKGKEIATAKVGEIVKLEILKNNLKLQNLKIEKNEILWDS